MWHPNRKIANKMARAWAKTPNGRASIRRSKLRYRYGLTEEDIARLLKLQKGHCALCSKTKNLVPDHCHKTGHVRGLLCKGHNIAVARLGDDIEGIFRAFKYLVGAAI